MKGVQLSSYILLPATIINLVTDSRDTSDGHNIDILK